MEVIREKSLLIVRKLSDATFEPKIAFDLDGTLWDRSKRLELAKLEEVNEKLWATAWSPIAAAWFTIHEPKQIVCFSNQHYMKNDEFLIKLVENTVGRFVDEFIVYFATANDVYRKPASGMYSKYVEEFGNTLETFVGDACGRKNLGGFDSISDVEFANNCNLAFMPPDLFFTGKNIYGPIETLIKGTVTLVGEELLRIPENLHTAVVMMIGSPASGKSTFVANEAEKAGLIDREVHIISNDIDKSNTAKTVLRLNEALSQAREREKCTTIFIDNCNCNETTRRAIFDKCREWNAKVFVVQFKTTKEVCIRLNNNRKLKRVEAIAIHSAFKGLNTKPFTTDEYEGVTEAIYRLDYEAADE